MKIKSIIIDMDNRFNKILPVFDMLNKENFPELRTIDIFSNQFSFYSLIKSSKDTFKSHLLLLSNLTISSSSDSSYALVVTNASVKNNVTMSITYIHICNKDVIKIIHHTVTNFIQLISLQLVDRFSQTKLC